MTKPRLIAMTMTIAMTVTASVALAQGPLVDVTVPELSETAQTGETAFNENCADCHGRNAAGSENGPPLIHKIYEPSHHADFAFVQAVRNGTRGHHWPFGNMPPIEGVSDQELADIIVYVREVQRANGID